MAGLYNFIGWAVIVFGFLATFIAITTGAFGANLILAMTFALGSILAAAPFFAIAEVLTKLGIMKDQQYRANELNEQLLAAQNRTNQLLEAEQ